MDSHTDKFYERMREIQCSTVLVEAELREDFVAEAAESEAATWDDESI